MKRAAIVIGIIILIALPIFLSILRYPDTFSRYLKMFTGQQRIRWPLIQTVSDQNRYSVESNVPGYTIVLLDTKFLDYVTENMGIFMPSGVIDPQAYEGGEAFRHSVTKIKLMLVPAVSQLMVAIPGQKEFAATSDYTVNNDTLILRVSISPNEVKSLSSINNGLEDVFLQASLQAMIYASVRSVDSKSLGMALSNARLGLKEYVHSGLMPWPIQIKYE